MATRILLRVLATLALLRSPVPLRAHGTTFTSQGQLTENGIPASRVFDFRLRLHVSAIGTFPVPTLLPS